MDWTKQLIRYIIVMLLQVLLFNQLQLWGACHPYIYVMDVFCNSLGVHMAACILLMFIRPYLIGLIVNDKDRLNEQISLRAIGMEALIKYVVILVLIHHLTVFMLAAWSWQHFGFVLLETLVSSMITISIIIGYNALKYK